MAKTVEVDLQVNNNLEPTIKNLRELKKQLRETAAGSKEFDRLSASIRDMEDSISDAKATNDDFLGQLENASGPLGALGQGIRGAERTFSSFNGALKASIIGIIVGTIVVLANANSFITIFYSFFISLVSWDIIFKPILNRFGGVLNYYKDNKEDNK